MPPTINWKNGKTRTAVNVVAALAWLVLLPIGATMIHSGIYVYGWIIGLCVGIPLYVVTIAHQPKRPITVTNETGKVPTEDHLLRIVQAGIALLVLLVIFLGLAATLILGGTFGGVWLQMQMDAVRGKRRPMAFMAVSAVVMIVVATIARFVL